MLVSTDVSYPGLGRKLLLAAYPIRVPAESATSRRWRPDVS